MPSLWTNSGDKIKTALSVGLLYVAAHVLLDAVSWVHGLSNLLITPWNPPAGLALAFMLLAGQRYFPAVVLACLLSDFLIRHEGFDIPSSVYFSLVFTCIYGLCARLLGHYRMRSDLQGLRDVLLLTGFSSLAALATVLLHVGYLVLMGHLPSTKLATGLFRHSVGDIIGIATTAPAVLVLWPQRRELWPLIVDLILPLVAALGMSWIIFGIESTDEFKFFYLLFPPLIWMAMRHGLKGAVIGVAATQISMMGITTWLRYEASTVTALQSLMLALALTTLLLAAVVEERGRAEANLREHQMSMAQMARLSLAGEMASGLAHELNQPLSAIVNYIKAAQGLLAQQGATGGEAGTALDKASSQAMRASQIIARLREFLQKGELSLEAISVPELAGEALSLISPTVRRGQIKLSTQWPANLPKVMADRIHIEQVLLNLVVNAIEAQAGLPADASEIVIEANLCAGDKVEISVIDRGPGIAPEIEGRLFEPFASTKSEGMGLGLMICRSIVEAHGGALWHDDRTPGRTAFRFTLPAADI